MQMLHTEKVIGSCYLAMHRNWIMYPPPTFQTPRYAYASSPSALLEPESSHSAHPQPSLLKLILQLQACLDIHAQQLLYQQLGRVRDRHAHDALAALARLAPPMIPHHAALLADIAFMGVTAQHQSFE